MEINRACSVGKLAQEKFWIFYSNTLNSQKILRITNTINYLLVKSHCYLTVPPLQITAMGSLSSAKM